MPGNDQALLVEHLQYREFGEIGELAVLQRMIREQDGIGPGFAGDAIDFVRQDQPALRQVLDRIRRTAAEHAQACPRDIHPLDTTGNVNLVDFRHTPRSKIPSRTGSECPMPPESQPSSLMAVINSLSTISALSLTIWQVPAFSCPPPP